jgi:hypothetical protein
MKEVIEKKPGRRRHNPLTRWSNSKHKGSLWSIRRETVKRRNQPDRIENVEYYVPHGLLYDPNITGGPEPFDTFKLDWKEELQHYAVNNEAKLRVQPLPNGEYVYRVYKEGESKDDPDHVLVEVVSQTKMLLKKRKK